MSKAQPRDRFCRSARHTHNPAFQGDLAARHGYTVLQAVQEWHNWKGASNGMPLGEVIKKFLAATGR